MYLQEGVLIRRPSQVSDTHEEKSRCRKAGIGGFPGGTVVKNPPANAGDTGLSPGPGRSHMLRSN